MNWRTFKIYVFWVILLAPGLYTTFKALMSEVSVGEWIQIGLTLGLSVVGLSIWLVRKWRTKYPFKVLHSPVPYNQGPSVYLKDIVLPLKEKQQIHLRLILRIARKFEWVNLRFVQWRWLKWDGWRSQFCFYDNACITGINISRSHCIDPYCESTVMKGTGQDFKFLGTFQIPAGDSLWFNVNLNAAIEWNGWLSFQLKRGDDHRGYGRIRISFISDSSSATRRTAQTWLERIGEPLGIYCH